MNYKKINLYQFLFFLLIILSAVNFLALLRHKSPYLSDSYFYKHIYFRYQRISDDVIYNQIIHSVNLNNADNITRNIFQNKTAYFNSLSFFTKRPLYPFLTYIINTFIKNEYISFLIPIFLTYLGSVVIIGYLSQINTRYFFSLLTISLFISFYPYLDWSTYFLTDTLGTFFWMLNILFVYKFLRTFRQYWLIWYICVLIISLFNREQGLLLLPFSLIMLVVIKKYSDYRKYKIRIMKIFQINCVIMICYLLTSLFLKLPSAIDTLQYTQNQYGLLNNNYSFKQTAVFYCNQLVKTHTGLLQELLRYRWWMIFMALALVKIFLMIKNKQFNIIDSLILSSGIAAYFSVFIYPVLSYRYFIPTVFTIIYFACKLLEDFSEDLYLGRKIFSGR